jgi:hypothetical protein
MANIESLSNEIKFSQPTFGGTMRMFDVLYYLAIFWLQAECLVKTKKPQNLSSNDP